MQALQHRLAQLLQAWHSQLQQWALAGPLDAAAREALRLTGTPAALEQLIGALGSGNLQALPPVQLLEASAMSGAAGAYAASTGTIYLNANWLTTASDAQVISVLTEELGHHLDSLLNSVDTPGDEGELFAALLTGEALSTARLNTLSKQIDSIHIRAGGDTLQAEAAQITDPNGQGFWSGTDNDDTLTWIAGGDLIDGQAGNDTLIISLNSADISISTNSTGVTYLLTPGSFLEERGITLVNIEALSLLDGIISITPTPAGSYIYDTRTAGTWSGTSLNDILVWHGGSDTIDGGTGLDTLSLRYNRNETVVFDYAGTVDKIYVPATNGEGGSLTLANVENIAFSDQDQSINTSTVNTLYLPISRSLATVTTDQSGITYIKGPIPSWGEASLYYGSGGISFWDITRVVFSDAEINIAPTPYSVIDGVGIGQSAWIGTDADNVFAWKGGGALIDGKAGQDIVSIGYNTSEITVSRNSAGVTYLRTPDTYLETGGLALINIETVALLDGTLTISPPLDGSYILDTRTAGSWNGTTADDILIWLGGSDNIDGGDGFDTLSLRYRKDEISLSLNGDNTYSLIAPPSNGDGGNLTLTNIEKLALIDGDISLLPAPAIVDFDQYQFSGPNNESGQWITSKGIRFEAIGPEWNALGIVSPSDPVYGQWASNGTNMLGLFGGGTNASTPQSDLRITREDNSLFRLKSLDFGEYRVTADAINIYGYLEDGSTLYRQVAFDQNYGMQLVTFDSSWSGLRKVELAGTSYSDPGTQWDFTIDNISIESTAISSTDTLLITSPGSGSLNSTPFTNTFSFNLDIGDDIIRLDEAFTHPALSATPLPEMSVDAGGDNDTFYGNSSDNILILTGINQGTLDGIAFSNMENIDLLGGNNTVYIRPGGQLTGTLNGGSSTFDLPDQVADPLPPGGGGGSSGGGGTGGTPIAFPITPNPSPNPVEGGFNAFFLNDNPNILNLTGAGSGTIDGTSFVNFAAIDMRGGQDTANIAAAGSLIGLLDGGADTDTLNLNDSANTLNLNADLGGSIQSGSGALTTIAGFEVINLEAGSDTANLNLDQNLPADGSSRQSISINGGTDPGADGSSDTLNLTLSAADLTALQTSGTLQSLLSYLANPTGLTYTANLAHTDLTLTGFEAGSLSNTVDRGVGTPGAITANGPLQEGVTLTAPTVSGDPNGDAASPNYAYQWLLNGTAIAGATTANYTIPTDAIAAADSNAGISVAITYTDAQGFLATVNAAAITVAKIDNGDATFALQSDGSALTGPVAIGSTLSASQLTGDSDGNLLAGTTLSYAWQTRSNATDPWATTGTADTYITTSADAGKQLQLLINYTDGQGYGESLAPLAASIEQEIVPPPQEGNVVSKQIDTLSLLISGQAGAGNTASIDKLGLVPKTVTIGRGRRQRTTTVYVPGWEPLESFNSIDGLTITAGPGLNTISGAGDGARRPAFNGQLILDGQLGVDVLTGGTTRNWLIGGGIVAHGNESALSQLGVDILRGTTGALDVFDLRSSDGLGDAYTNSRSGQALISNFTIGEDAIVLAGAATAYNVNINTVTQGGGRQGRGRRARIVPPTTTTSISITSALTGDTIASFAGTTFSPATTPADLNIHYGVLTAPADTLINGQNLFLADPLINATAATAPIAFSAEPTADPTITTPPITPTPTSTEPTAPLNPLTDPTNPLVNGPLLNGTDPLL